MGTKVVPGHTWALEWLPGTFGNWKGAWAHIRTEKVPRLIRAPKRCRGT